MSSALDTLLAAARYIELQEQHQLSVPSSPTSIRNLGRFHNQNFNNSTNMNNSSTNTTRNNLRHQQVSSPSISPVYSGLTSRNNTLISVEVSANGNNQSTTSTAALSNNFGSPTISSDLQGGFHPTDARSANNGNLTTPSGSVSTAVINNNGNPQNNVLSTITEDSSQSSLNLSSSGYLSGSSVNSTPGSCTSNLNLNHSTGINNSVINSDHQIPIQTQSATARRRTTSTNSNGAGTREVHNKLEKHRRAHLKECFEQLKTQLQLKDEEKKKPSNLAILGAAYRHVMFLRRKERELEQQVEQLAKDKINAQKKILSLKRELSFKYDNIDFTNIISEGDVTNIPTDRESLSDSASLSSGRGSIRYSSSSSLSSVATISSPIGANIHAPIPATMSPVISSSSSILLTTSPSSPLLKSSSPVTNHITPLSLATKNTSPMESPIPSTPCPSPSSSSGISCSPITSSASPPISNNLPSETIKLTNVPNGIKLNPISTQTSIAIVSTPANSLQTSIINISSNNSSPQLTSSSSGIQPFGFNTHNVQITNSPKDLNGKNGICRKNLDSRELSSSSIISVNGGNIGCAKEIKVEKIFGESEQPTKVIKLFNGIALAPVDKVSSTPLALSQVVSGGGLVVSPFPVLTTPSQGLRVIGTNGLATIELSSPTVQSHSRNQQHMTSPSVTTVTSNSTAQLHKLLVSAGTQSQINHSTVNSTLTHTATVTPELARLPGGAELNILPAGTNGSTTLYRNGKLAIVNSAITLKGNESAGSAGRAVHVVTPIQSGGAPISGLTPIMVSQGQQNNNIAQLIASSPQLTGKVNLSVGGQTLPLISTQYLSSMKPMVVAVASNPTSTTSITGTTLAENGNVS